MLPQSIPSTVLLLNFSFQPTWNSWAPGCPQVTYMFIHMTLKWGIDMFTPLVQIVEYFDTQSCSSWCTISHFWTHFLLPRDPAPKRTVPITAGSLKDTVTCVDLHPFCLVSAPMFWFLNIFVDYLHIHNSSNPSSSFWPHLLQVIPTDVNKTEIFIFQVWICIPVSLTILETWGQRQCFIH